MKTYEVGGTIDRAESQLRHEKEEKKPHQAYSTVLSAQDTKTVLYSKARLTNPGRVIRDLLSFIRFFSNATSSAFVVLYRPMHYDQLTTYDQDKRP